MREPVRTQLAASVAAWSERWFARRRARLHDWRRAAGAARSAEAWRVHYASVAIALPARSRVIDWALDMRLEPFDVTETDRLLLDGLERRIVADLARQIEAALRVDGAPRETPLATTEPWGAAGGATLEITDENGADIAQAAIPFEALLGACKASMRAPRTDRPRPERVSAALAAQRLTLAARLGQAEIALSELRALAPGDVLVLDRDLDSPAELVVEGARAVVAKAKLTDIGGRAALALQA